MSNVKKMKSLLLVDSLGILVLGVASFVFFLNRSTHISAKAWGIAGATATVGVGLIVFFGSMFLSSSGRIDRNSQVAIAIAGICATPMAYLVLALIETFGTATAHVPSSIRDGEISLLCATCLIGSLIALLISSAMRLRKNETLPLTTPVNS